MSSLVLKNSVSTKHGLHILRCSSPHRIDICNASTAIATAGYATAFQQLLLFNLPVIIACGVGSLTRTDFFLQVPLASNAALFSPDFSTAPDAAVPSAGAVNAGDNVLYNRVISSTVTFHETI